MFAFWIPLGAALLVISRATSPGAAARPAAPATASGPLYVPAPAVQWAAPAGLRLAPDCGPGCVFTTHVHFPGPATVDLRARLRGHGWVTFTAADLGDPIRADADEWAPLEIG